MFVFKKIGFESIVFLFAFILFQLISVSVSAQACNRAKPANCKQWDQRSCRCMVEEVSQRYDARDLSTMTEDKQTADGRCKAKLSGTNGCYTLNGGCQVGPQFCRSQSMCQSNMPRGANYWDGRTCQSSPVQPEKEQAKTCPPSQKEGPGYDANGNDITACVCDTTGKQPVAGKCSAKNEAGEGKSLAQKCSEADGDWSQEGAVHVDDGICTCLSDGSTIDVINGNAKCKTVAAEKKCIGGNEIWSQSPVGPIRTCQCNGQVVAEVGNCSSVAASDATTEDEDAKFARVLKECGLDGMQERIDECKENSDEAVVKCEKKAFESDKNAQQLGGIMKMLSTVQQNKAVEMADPDACGKAAYGATAAYWALDTFKTTCNDEVKKCKESCAALKEGETFKQLSQKCEQAYNTAFNVKAATNGLIARSAGLAAAKLRVNANRIGLGIQEPETHEESRAMIRGFVSKMETTAKDNLIKCESDAVKGEADIGKYLAELLNASMGAAQCKTSASNIGARCLAMAPQLTQVFCKGNPEICCDPFRAATPINCNGADYSSRTCVCARSPDSSGCKVVTTTPPVNLNNPGGVATMAAPGGIKSGNQYKPQGAITQGAIDLNDSSDPGKPQPQAAGGGAVNPFGVAGGGGGGGGGGLPSSPSDGLPAGAAAGEGGGDKGLVGGAFNQLKTLADRVFGTGSSNSGGKGYGTGKDGKKNGVGVDPNKWKPGLRGVAGGVSPFGPRNKDIWKIMNVQYGIQNHTFIGVEGK